MNILSLDLSLSNSGGCVFTTEGKPLHLFSIFTSSKLEHKDRLRTIGDRLLEVKNKYDIDTVVLESGFSRFSISTQALFKVQGVVSYLFSDCSQKNYAPSSIKKVVTGNGRADKKEVEIYVKKIWPNIQIANDDESDALAVGLCYFIKTGIIKDGKFKAVNNA